MIIEYFLAGIYRLMDMLLGFEIPPLPAEVYDYIEILFGYMEMGAGILINYTPFVYLMSLFGIILMVDMAIAVYHLVMWVIRKIPLAGIE